MKDKPYQNTPPPPRGLPEPLSAPPRKAHLLDVGGLLEVAVWIAKFVAASAAAGVVGNAAYDLLRNLKRRHGSERIRELEEKTLELIEEELPGNGADQEALKRKVSELFDDFL